MVAPQRRRVRRRRKRPNNTAQGWGALAGFALVFALMYNVLAPALGFSFNDGIGAGSGSGSAGAGRKPSNDSQKILAEAVKFDSTKYEPAAYVWAGGHPPKAWKKGRGVDCSGLINVAVLRATGVNENQVAESFRRSKHWKPIHMKEARAGDIMFDLKDSGWSRGKTDHVAFVVENKGSGKLKIFHARTSSGPAKDQIRYDKGQEYRRFDGALRFTRTPKR